jgi:hypothetical protein
VFGYALCHGKPKNPHEPIEGLQQRAGGFGGFFGGSPETGEEGFAGRGGAVGVQADKAGAGAEPAAPAEELIPSGGDPTDLTRPQLYDRSQESGHEREQVFERIARGHQDDDAERWSTEVLLELQVRFGGDENLKSVRSGAAQQLAVGQPGPASLLNRAGLVAQELASQLARQLLIEQNAHAR